MSNYGRLLEIFSVKTMKEDEGDQGDFDELMIALENAGMDFRVIFFADEKTKGLIMKQGGNGYNFLPDFIFTLNGKFIKIIEREMK